MISVAGIWKIAKLIGANRQYVVIVAAVGWALWERGDYQECKAQRAAEQIKARDAIIAQKNKDRALADAVITDQAQTIAQLANKTSTHTEVIRHVQVTTACRDTPAMRAADDGLSDLGFTRQPRPATDANAPAPRVTPARP